MADGTCIHLEVALECGENTIRGVVDDRGGAVVEFSGWLELMSAFDTVCARATANGGKADSGLLRDRSCGD
ncbi:MAG: hypothetical protein QOG15_2928 [Solirubrobacteraceae bacterium]|jgi:hypothetical protein|nr:hypothetical protein [Solirubrobacteraceae bacterium]